MATKKDFSKDLTNPALSFISDPEEVKEAKKKTPKETHDRLEGYIDELKKAGYKILPAENRTKRVQLVTTESLFAAAKAKIEGKTDPLTGRPLSFNSYINNLISEDLKKE